MAIFASIILLASACSDSEPETSPRASQAPTVTEDPVATSTQDQDPTSPSSSSSSRAGWTEDDAEYKLAVIDEGGFVRLTDPIIDRYAAALDEVDSSCQVASRTLIGDQAVTAVRLLAEAGRSATTLELLEALPAATAGTGLEGSLECSEVFAVLTTLMVG